MKRRRFALAAFPSLVTGAVFLPGVWAAERQSAVRPKPARCCLGLNLAGLGDLNTEYPLVDAFKLSRPWISQRQGDPWGKGPALELDADGWPRRLETECWVETPMLTFGHAPAGDYVCLYDGEGEIEFAGARARITSRSPGRLVVNLDPRKEGVFLRLKATRASNPVRHIRMLLPGCEATYLKQPFNPPFLQRWQGFDTIRFMDWMETNNSGQRDWKDRPTPATSTFGRSGAPVELMVDLCNQLRANPWFCMPHPASDDYVRRFAQLVKKRLDPRLKVYVEYSNEVWNNLFAQHRYAEEQAAKLGLGDPGRPWEGAAHYHAQRSVEMFKLWEDVFGGHARLVRVIAWQAASGDYWTDKMVLAHHDAWKDCDALAIAPYISVIVGPESKPGAEEVAGWTVAQLLDHAEKTALPECLGWMRLQKKVADKYGLKLICYEAGQHLVGVGGAENNEDLTRLFLDANRHERMGAIYTQYLEAWRKTGGDLMALFSSVGKYSKWGSWGLLEYGDETGSPKFDAVIEWKRRNQPP